MSTKQINIKNRTYYFYNDIIELNNFDGSKIKIDKKDFDIIDIYYIRYEMKKQISKCNEINSANLLYLKINSVIGILKKVK